MNIEMISQLRQYLLDEKPVVLFLGQAFSAEDSSGNRFLEAALQKFGVEGTSSGWRGLFAGRALGSDDYDWLAERFDRQVYGDGIQAMLDVAWSSVFTTSIDPQLKFGLETRGRIPESVLARDHFARVPRSRARPAIHYLFGVAGQHDTNYRPAFSRAELKRRLAVHANQFINRISETVTPLGLLVIDGLIPNEDWLEVDDLLAPISEESGLRIHWYGLKEKPDSDFFEDLVSKGIVHFDATPLCDVVAFLHASDGPELGKSTQSEIGTITLVDGKIFQVPPSLRLTVEASAAIVDDTWTDEVLPLSRADEYEAFKRFHGDLVGTKGMVEGVARGFSIQRDFQELLRNAVERMLKSAGGSEFIVVHGQSGVGKSVGMAQLAYWLRVEQSVPVLFSWGRVPSASELDDFCAGSEKAGASGTVVICDANQDFDRYRELAAGLRSRGRKAVIVGTSYKIEGARKDKHLIVADSEMSSFEFDYLKRLLGRYGIEGKENPLSASTNHNTLAMLYRHLSVSRSRITSGIAGEARAAEAAIRLRAKAIPRQRDAGHVLAEKLIAAGAASESTDLFADDVFEAEYGTSAAGVLVDYVMAAGRLDCAVPVNMVIRAVKNIDVKLDITQIAYLFEELDLFRWRMADAEGNDLLIQPRLQLEAELICKRRLANVATEIDRITELIGAARANAVDRSSELDFLLSILPKLNKEGPRQSAYEQGYLKIAEALTSLRTTHQVMDARLILQESAFRRSAVYVIDHSNYLNAPNLDREARAKILNEAREIVEMAIEAIAEKRLRASKKTRHNLLVERASIYGYLAVGLAQDGAQDTEIWPHYLAARMAISRAVSASDSYHSLDVGMWTPGDILGVAGNSLSPVHKAELKADIQAIIDEVNIDSLSAPAVVKFHWRRARVGEAMGDILLTEDALSELERISPSLAYYLRARAICSELFLDDGEILSIRARQCAEEAARFLKARFTKISSDARPLQLLLQTQWAAFTGRRLQRLERFVIPMDNQFIRSVYETVTEINLVAGDGARNVFRFLEATLSWVQGEVHVAREMFRELEQDTEFEDPSRIVRRLVLESSDRQGFQGRVERQRSAGHWIVSLPGFEGTIDLLERDFKHENIKVGRELRRFNIAFNYLGPIADPILQHGGAQ